VLPASIVPSANLPAADPALPSAPAPIIVSPPNPHYAVFVNELMAQSRRNQRIWIGLALTEHAAATLDAYSTRRAITTQGAQELNPIFKPFAGNASIYAAVQAWPIAMDFLAKKLMYSRHPWARHMWWVPQSASAAGSILCGVHNLGVRRVGN
jgi:hypothetical protein